MCSTAASAASTSSRAPDAVTSTTIGPDLGAAVGEGAPA